VQGGHHHKHVGINNIKVAAGQTLSNENFSILGPDSQR